MWMHHSKMCFFSISLQIDSLFWEATSTRKSLYSSHPLRYHHRQQQQQQQQPAAAAQRAIIELSDVL